MKWTLKAEEIILDTLIAGVKHQGELIEKTLKSKESKIKRHFKGRTERSIISKAKSLCHEAILADIQVFMPGPAPKPPKAKKPTAADLRKAMFARKTKMTPQERGRKEVQDALSAARMAVKAREKAVAAAKKARDDKKKANAKAS